MTPTLYRPTIWRPEIGLPPSLRPVQHPHDLKQLILPGERGFAEAFEFSRIGTPGAMTGGLQSLNGAETRLFGANGPAVPSVAGYTFWFNSQQGLFQDTGGTTPAVSDGDVVKLWKDQSANANDISESMNPPVLKLNILNGLPSIRFDGVNDQLAATFTFSQPWTIFSVFKVLTAAGGKIILGGTLAGVPTRPWQYTQSNNTTLRMITNVSSSTDLTGCDYTSNYGACCWQGRASPANVNGYWHSPGANVSNTTGGGAVDDFGGLNLGGGSDGFNQQCNCDICEVIGYPSLLSSGDISTEMTQLGARYGLF